MSEAAGQDFTGFDAVDIEEVTQRSQAGGEEKGHPRSSRKTAMSFYGFLVNVPKITYEI